MTENIASAGEKKTVFGLILGVPAAVLLLSTGLFYMADSRNVDMGTVNRGELINPPLELAAQPLKGPDALPRQPFRSKDSRWMFLVRGGAVCGDVCEKMLYLTRQTHVALGKRQPRVLRAYISDQAPGRSTLSMLSKEHDDMLLLQLEQKAWEQMFASTGIDIDDEAQFFLVDPNGWLMMSYRPDSLGDDDINTLGKDVIRDIKRLLK